jgi:Tol biopolymer transport system component
MGRSPTRNGLFRIQRDGAVVKFLAPGVSGDGIPAWAPDGVRIAWRATGHVAMVDTSGVPLEPLPLISGIDVSWTATGDGIVYSSPTLVGDRVFLYHLNTHRITQLTE